MTAFSLGAVTDVGQIRSVNQDDALTAANLAAVADGMGGHLGGEVASEIALRSLGATSTLRSLDDLRAAVAAANRAVYERSRERADLRGMGTTLCAVAMLDPGSDTERVALVNVGDSRIYRLHDGELFQETEDHNLVQTLLRDGRIQPDEVDNHPQRNIVTRALGVEAAVEIDGFVHQANLGDRYLLCSDGLHGEVSRDAIEQTLLSIQDPGEAARTLVRMANDHGGRDNITCVVVDLVDDDTVADAATQGPHLLRSDANAARADGEATDVYPVTGADPDQTLTIDDIGETLPRVGPPIETPIPKALQLASQSELRPLRRFTWRVVAFLVAIGVIAVAAAGAVIYFAGNSYFVGTADNEVVIYQGRPDGFLWLEPTVHARTGLEVTDLPEVLAEQVREPASVTNLADARAKVTRLQEDRSRYEATPTGSDTSDTGSDTSSGP